MEGGCLLDDELHLVVSGHGVVKRSLLHLRMSEDGALQLLFAKVELCSF